MSQPKRRAALLGAASVSLAVLALAPGPVHAQFVGGMAMPPAMLPPGFGSGASAGGMQPSLIQPNRGGMPMPGMPVRAIPAWPSGVPGGYPYSGRTYNRSFNPAYGMPSGNPVYGVPASNPAYGVPSGRSYAPGFSRTWRQAAPVPSASSEAPSARTDLRRSGADVGFYGAASGTQQAVPLQPARRPLRTEMSPRLVPGSPDYRLLRRAYEPPAPIDTTNNGYIYAPETSVTVVGGPSLLGGFYYGNYCDTYSGINTYPSVYSTYVGFPPYIYTPGVSYQSLSPQPVYITNLLPFNPPQYQVTYNQTNYYVGSEDKAAQIEDGGAPAKQAVRQAFPADSYQAAFADIERAWTDGNLDLLKNHLRGSDTKLSVFLGSKYKYSLKTSDFTQITRDAFDRLDTVSFAFTRLRKAKNGDVTAYGKHVYRVASAVDKGGQDRVASDNTVPFDSTAPPAATDGPVSAASAGQVKTVYVSYTLRHSDGGWYITGVDSSANPLVKEAK